MSSKECRGCGLTKGRSFFARGAELCSLCVAAGVKAAELPPEKPAEVPLDDAPAPLAAFPTVELDYDHPSAQEIASRTLARRKLIQFIKRFRPKYLPGWVHEDICRRLERFMKDVEEGKSPRLLMMMPPRAGKQLADETLVPTPTGWTTHGELRAGSLVFHPSGKPQKVTAVSEKTVSDVRVEFSDGSVFYCHENHVWNLYDRARGRYKNVPAKYFLEANRFGERTKLTSGGRHTYQIAPVAALEFEGVEYSMHPYVLGAWLGDGSAGKPCISGAASDGAITAKMESLGYPVSTVCVHNTTGVLTTYFSGGGKQDSGLTVRKVGKRPGRMSQELMTLGIFKNKRIPEEYQYLTIDLRLELLAGLVDTDGSVDKNGRVVITTVSAELADDIVQLCEGLGFRPYKRVVAPTLSTSGIQGRKDVYLVGFQPTMQLPVTLERKKIKRIATQRRVGLVSVERVEGGRQGHCVEVESPDGLYVVGKQLIPTHNSEIGSRNFVPFVLGHHPDWEIIAASHTNSLTMSFSRYIRDLLRDPSYHALFPHTQLDPSSQSVENWNLTSGGGYLAAGVGTGITGRGAHILLLDDLVKDIEAADSQNQRDNTWEWYASTAYTRLAPGGGVLGIMCMTGDTPVLMADGTERRLDTLAPGDEIATYARGILASTTVAAMKSSGSDLVFRIMTKSGKIVRANQRHPFLTVAPSGEVSWTRVKDLNTASRIVIVKDSGVSGKASSAPKKSAQNLPHVADIAASTIRGEGGKTGIVPERIARLPAGVQDSNTVMESRQQITTLCTRARTAAVQYVKNLLQQVTRPSTGNTSLLLTTATTQEKLERCYVTTATQESDTLVMSQWHWPPQGISDFTLDEIINIELDGIEEVYDVQVAATENFIANGLVSHNTWWNEDDWAGRIQQVMATGEGDKFEIIRYPAINDEGDEYILPDDSITQIREGQPVPEGSKLTRTMGTAIHPKRYTTKAMLRIKANLEAAGQKRIWNALYQQNPTPEEGIHFTKKMFREYSHTPQLYGASIYQAWDFAITEGEQNDWTVGITVLHDSNDDIYILDVNRFRSGDGEELIATVVDYAIQWKADTLGFEDGQIWKALQSTYTRVCQEKRHYPAYEILKPLTDKLVRAQPLRGRMQAGKVHFPKSAPWVTTLKNELLKFPGGKNDDQVDALAWAIRLILMKSPPKVMPTQQLKSWKDKLHGMIHGTTGGGHMSA